MLKIKSIDLNYIYVLLFFYKSHLRQMIKFYFRFYLKDTNQPDSIFPIMFSFHANKALKSKGKACLLHCNAQ